jgi:serine protease Do
MILDMQQLAPEIDAALANMVQRVLRSLVVVHNGKHGAGAGIVWRAGGYIVTNYHVIARGRPYVDLPGGIELPARLVAERSEFDLALLQVEAPGQPVALIADSHLLRVGQLVLAVGHPWGQKNAVTGGIVSGLGKAEVRGRNGRHSQRSFIDIIRSDVSLAPGNSGGPLVNSMGGVVGVNTMIVGGDLGVAIPSHVVNNFLSETLDDTVMRRAEVMA